MKDRKGIKTVTLIGSRRFEQEFRQTEKVMTYAGYTVNSIFIFSDDLDIFPLEGGALRRIQVMYNNRIADSDFVIVIDKDEYVGDATAAEIEMANRLGIPVEYYSKVIKSAHYIGKY